MFAVNAYNDDFVDNVVGRLHCEAGDGAEAIDVCSGPQKIPAAEYKTFRFIIGKDLVSKSSTRICNIEFFDGTTTTNCATLPSDPEAHVESEQVVVAIK